MLFYEILVTKIAPLFSSVSDTVIEVLCILLKYRNEFFILYKSSGATLKLSPISSFEKLYFDLLILGMLLSFCLPQM